MFVDIIKDLKERKQGMIAYMYLKIKEQDWHGVADAAMDIREIETELKVYSELLQGYSLGKDK